MGFNLKQSSTLPFHFLACSGLLFVWMWFLFHRGHSHCHSFANSKEKQKRYQMTNEIHATNKRKKTFSYSFRRAGERLLSKRLKMAPLPQWYKVISLSELSARFESIFFLFWSQKVFHFQWIWMRVSRMCIQMQCIPSIGSHHPTELQLTTHQDAPCHTAPCTTADDDFSPLEYWLHE